MNVKDTSDRIREMGKVLGDYAAEMDKIADKMDARNDIFYASEAVSSIVSMFGTLQLSLLVAKPLRAMEEQIEAMTEY